MPSRMRGMLVRAALAVALLLSAVGVAIAASADDDARIEQALHNVLTLERPGKTGLATIWVANAWVQCRRLLNRALRCEAAGLLMQPSLARILTPAQIADLDRLGWRIDPAFGNYVRTFDGSHTLADVARSIRAILVDIYRTDPYAIELSTDWLPWELCPPRSGPRQNLAGSINGSKRMAGVVIHACSYTPPATPVAGTLEQLIASAGPRISAEIERLHINHLKSVFVVVDFDFAYVQCAPDPETDGIYCETASADSQAALGIFLTPERIARLHRHGFNDPGLTPNFWKIYATGSIKADAVAADLLAVIYDVYEYRGEAPFKYSTETGRQ